MKVSEQGSKSWEKETTKRRWSAILGAGVSEEAAVLTGEGVSDS